MDALAQETPLRESGTDVVFRVLPTQYAVLDAWHDELDVIRPDAILHFGLAVGARAIRIETRAMNAVCPYRRDAAGMTPSRIIDPGGPAIRRVTMPLGALHKGMAQRGLAVRRSQDAGAYLCNAILYASLAWCAGQRQAHAVFIHVPLRPVAELLPAARGGGSRTRLGDCVSPSGFCGKHDSAERRRQRHKRQSKGKKRTLQDVVGFKINREWLANDEKCKGAFHGNQA